MNNSSSSSLKLKKDETVFQVFILSNFMLVGIRDINDKHEDGFLASRLVCSVHNLGGLNTEDADGNNESDGIKYTLTPEPIPLEWSSGDSGVMYAFQHKINSTGVLTYTEVGLGDVVGDVEFVKIFIDYWGIELE